MAGTVSSTGTPGFEGKVACIWSVADLLRGDYKASEYGKVILSLVTLRRLDCVLAPTKAEVAARVVGLPNTDAVRGPVLSQITMHQGLYNTSPKAVIEGYNNGAVNPRAHVSDLPPGGREGIRRFGFDEQLTPPSSDPAALPRPVKMRLAHARQ